MTTARTLVVVMVAITALAPWREGAGEEAPAAGAAVAE